MLKKGLRKIDGEDFYLEKLQENVYTISRVKKVHYRGKSKFQYIEVIELEGFGKTLYLDGVTQICERDEFIYHETFVHPIMVTHPSPKKVLIIGGGDGGVAREVLKYSTVSEVTLVEIDPMVIEVVKKFFGGSLASALEDPRLTIIIEDGTRFLEEAPSIYDVVFIDVTDEVGPAAFFYKEEVLGKLRNIVDEKGIVSLQSLGVIEHKGAQERIKEILSKFFSIVGFYTVFIPSFTGLWTFAFASDHLDPRTLTSKDVEKRILEEGIQTRFYSPSIHGFLFETSRYIDLLKNV
ncbi:MAG: polyamine aminopropyltransferase [Thermoproteales archaeon]|nr:polyamine aminopropyltransferase [Thermoproteales archaeon]RLE66929.1 MAG: polyamine aminopropyltransferase [Thermoprotei archaeon]